MLWFIDTIIIDKIFIEFSEISYVNIIAVLYCVDFVYFKNTKMIFILTLV